MTRILLGAAARLPLALLHGAGAALGWAIYWLSPTYRRHLHENLAAAGLPDSRTRRGAIGSAGKMLIELPLIWLRPRDKVLALVREVRGVELVEAARSAGKGIVFLTPHLGCFEITAQVAAARFPITVLYRPPKLAWLQPLIEEGRGQDNVRLASADYGGVRRILAALHRREAVGILPDQVPGEGEGEWVEFFGKPAYTMTFAARLARRADSVCLLAFGERLARGRGYVVHVRPLPPALPGENGARHLNRAVESLIRARPEQYLWGYNRYKVPRGARTGPEGPSAPPDPPAPPVA
jgi:KDO2-lipid IV(A) lauroyltransferase